MAHPRNVSIIEQFSHFIVVLREARSRFPIELASILVLIIGFYFFDSQAAHAAKSIPSIDGQVKTIESEVNRIESAAERSGGSELHEMEKELAHWQFSVLFQRSFPILLSARFTEGQVVKQELYYLLNGKLIMIRVDKWWDIEDSRKAPERPSRQLYYLVDNSVIRCVNKDDSRSRATRINDTRLSAAPLLERYHLILNILQDWTAGTGSADFLQSFPDLKATTQ